jgi:uncharacterized RDD family membrane protein YckC
VESDGKRRISILACEKCGKEIQEGASFCPQCGFPVTVGQIGPVYVPQSAYPPETIPALPQAVVAQARPAYAGFWLRAVAYAIDTILISVVFGLAASFHPTTFFKSFDFDALSLTNVLHQLTPIGLATVIFAPWLYYALFEASAWQATPGKRMVGLYVTDLNERPITFARATIRNVAKMLSQILLIGYVLSGFTEKKQALHDILASCLVLRRPQDKVRT